MEKGYLKEIAILKHQKGKPKIRTANPEAFHKTLEKYAPSLTEKNKEEMMFWIKNLGDAVEYFLPHLSLCLKNGVFKIYSLPWLMTLSNFFMFCHSLIWSLVETVEDEDVEEALTFGPKIISSLSRELSPSDDLWSKAKGITNKAVLNLKPEQKKVFNKHIKEAIRERRHLEFASVFVMTSLDLFHGRWYSYLTRIGLKSKVASVSSRIMREYLKRCGESYL